MNKKLMIKICGLKDPANIMEVSDLNPDFMGFVLYPGSPRYINPEDAAHIIKNIPQSIKKVGVIVNEPIGIALKIAESGAFDFLQLHGNENIEYCYRLSSRIDIIKTFPVSRSLPDGMADYQEYCRMFLFDTAGKSHGGGGKQFDHTLLRNYSLDKHFILSGGISPTDSDYLRSMETDNLIGVDLNSRFELKPGIKDAVLLKNFIGKLRYYETSN
jgi:phosphoribosylanthranilate isomerase